MTTRGQRRRERTRSDLLEAARDCFRRYGFVETTVSRITATADVAHGTFYNYFTDRDEIFAEIADRLLDELFDDIAEPERDPSLRRRLHLAITDFLRKCRTERATLTALYQAGQLSDAHADRWAGFRDRLRERVNRDLTILRRLRHLPVDTNVELVSTVVTRMLEGVALQVMTDETAEVDELAAVTAELYFHGVFGADVVSG